MATTVVFRSPSPEPVYDSNGKRLNTREVRKRQELEQLRHEKIQALLRINPNYKPPADYRFVLSSYIRRSTAAVRRRSVCAVRNTPPDSEEHCSG